MFCLGARVSVRACVCMCVCVKSSLLSSVQQVPITSAAPLLIRDIKDEGGRERGALPSIFSPTAAATASKNDNSFLAQTVNHAGVNHT